MMAVDARGSFRSWTVSATVGGVWLLVVLLSTLVSLTPLSRVQQAVLPSVTPYVWSWTAPWPVLLPLAGAVAVSLVHAAIMGSVRTQAPFATTWLASVAAGAAAGLTVDAVLVFGTVFTHGWALWALDLGSRAALGAYWGLLYGWIPAWVALRRSRRTDRSPQPRSGLSHPLLLAAIAAAGLSLLGATQLAGDAATQAQLREEDAAAPAAPADGSARPDPNAPGEPVPERAESAGGTEANACTPERATMLIGGIDGATGHRGLRVELMNFSESGCVITGYPDIAFGDQNAHLLNVTLEQGGSFMAADPGPTPVEIPAGDSAVAYIGWDANSVHGALVAQTLWAAPLPGQQRGSWPIDSDIVEGSTVSVTAWALPE